MRERILRVVRGEATEVYRVRLREDGAAELQRFDNGVFAAARVFRGGGQGMGFDEREPDGDAKMDRAVRYIGGFLNGTVNVGERDLLSPTSALARNVRWFPGDIQMLRTSFPYIRELFPSAQFHVTQLFRRVFGDVCFLALVVLSTASWLRNDAPVASRRLALGLQVVSMMAIIGFDRYWEPLRLRLRRIRQNEWMRQGWRMLYRVPAVVLSQLVLGTVSVVVNTLMGLANLVIHPVKIWEAWRQLRGGGALEWKASSVSAAQDVRGWPLAEFMSAYRPAVLVGLATAGFGLWLVSLGAPVGMLGLNGVGIFVASFLTVVLYAWWSGLPHDAEGRPEYRLSRKELGALLLVGLLGCVLSALLFRLGLYPMPAFEGSIAIVMLFLSLSALLALLFPGFYLLKQRPRAPSPAQGGGPGRSRRPPHGSRSWSAAIGVFLFTTVTTCQSEKDLRGDRLAHFLHVDERDWRMPEPERQLYEDVERTVRRHGRVDPEPLLRAEGDQATLARQAGSPTPELNELRGIPTPRLPRLTALASLVLPELYPLPQKDRALIFKPQRQFVAPPRDPSREAAAPVEAGMKATEVAQRRAAAVTPRRLSRDELRVQDRFIERARYPWITPAELRRLAERDATGESIPIVEMARAYRWDDARDLWAEVEAARRGGVPDRVRLQRLRDGIEGVIAIGRSPTAVEVEKYLEEELALIAQWSRDYPHLPLGALRDGPGTTASRFSQVTRFVLGRRVSRDALARDWRLDYVDTYWNGGPTAEAIHQVFRERPRSLPWETLELDWDGNETLRRRWNDLQTEQALAVKVWRAAPSGGSNPTPRQLHDIVLFLEKVLGPMLSGDASGPYGVFAHLFRLEGVDPEALRTKDTVTAIWASRVWTEAMAGRVAEMVYRASTGEALPGSDADRALVREVSRTRYPDDAGDPMLRRVLEWLVLVDNAQTYSELAAGYDRFAAELADRGLTIQGLARAPRLSEDQLFRDLLDLWRTLPRRFSELPARDDMVGELLVHSAYFSSRDGREPRTPAEFLDDFSQPLQEVNGLMREAPPPEIQALADRHIETTLGRISQTARGRRFFAWWMVAEEARVLQNNFAHHGVGRVAEPRALAASWAEILQSGARRWPRLPWSSPGFTEFYLNTRALEGWTVDDLWSHFGGQLTEADGLMARHVVPSKTLEALVDRRIQEKTGASTLDPTLRQVNAVMALARLLEVARANGVDGFAGNPALLTEKLSLLYERLARDYPHLYWDGEGMLEFYLLLGRRQDWEVDQTVERFDPEWSLANTLAASGWLDRLEVVARKDERSLGRGDRGLSDFIDVQARRLEQRTGLEVKNPRTRAMNALMALSTLVLGAGEEGQIPDQHGEPWSQGRVRAWAGALEPGRLRPSTLAWVESLTSSWAELLHAMRAEGPHFPWHRGSVVENSLLVMRNAGLGVPALREARRGAWKEASDLVARGVVPPAGFVEMVRADSKADLRRKIAAAHGVSAEQVADSEVTPDDPTLASLDATLVLADVVAQIRAAYGESPDPLDVARRILEIRAEGPRRYAFVPWLAKGFTPAFLVAAYRKDFRDDPWKYAELIDLPRVDQLMGELSRSGQGTSPGAGRGGGGVAGRLPADVVADVRAIMREQTGRTPASDQVVAYQTLRDGAFLLREFLPRVPLTLGSVVTLARLRTAIRAMSADYPDLHIVRAEDQSVRVGFAERLAVLAMKQGLEAGHDPARATFVASCLELVKNHFLKSMNKIYVPLRATLTPEEIAYYQQSIRDEARADNGRRAARLGLSSDALSVPDVKEDDLVADSALYEILYATEIGQDQEYLTDLFSIFGQIRRRPETGRAYHAGLASIDARYAGALVSPSEPGYQSWRASDAYGRWWKERGDFIKASRGQIIALSRTFALVKRKAFSPSADPAARASFARFGDFDRYLDAFFSAFEEIPRVPELAAALGRLRDEDPFLADGMRFALALFKSHVVDHLYPEPGAAHQVLTGISGLLPAVTADYQQILGFSPRLESGVPLYDARMSFLRRDTDGGSGWPGEIGSGVYRRLNLVQRGVQRWTEAYFLEHAYKVLFFRELDAEDPTPAARPRPARWLHRTLGAMVDRVVPHTRGDETTTFLEERLPAILYARTGSRDLSVWIGWLMQHGEVGLDGAPTGQNPYAEEIAGYEARLAHYRARIEEGRASGSNVRAEEQRVRDIEKEYDSFQHQISWLLEAAQGSSRLTARARRDYSEAIWFHAGVPLVLVLVSGLAVRRLGRRRGDDRTPRRLVLGAAFVWLPLVLCMGASVGVALRPARAASLAPRLLQRAHLLEPEQMGGWPGDTPGAGRLRPRGAAAQLAKLLRRDPGVAPAGSLEPVLASLPPAGVDHAP
jgi:hypothetical protein